jgi:hypothetical protein
LPLDPTWEGATVGWEADYGRSWFYPIFEEDDQKGIAMHYGVEQGRRGFGDSDPFSFTEVSPIPDTFDLGTGTGDANQYGQVIQQPTYSPTVQPTYNPQTPDTQQQSVAPLIAADVAGGLKVLESIFGNPASVAAQNQRPVTAPYYSTVPTTTQNQAGVSVGLNNQGGLSLNVGSILLWGGVAIFGVMLISKMGRR